jgi:hypothetical protein
MTAERRDVVRCPPDIGLFKETRTLKNQFNGTEVFLRATTVREWMSVARDGPIA